MSHDRSSNGRVQGKKLKRRKAMDYDGRVYRQYVEEDAGYAEEYEEDDQDDEGQDQDDAEAAVDGYDLSVLSVVQKSLAGGKKPRKKPKNNPGVEMKTGKPNFFEDSRRASRPDDGQKYFAGPRWVYAICDTKAELMVLAQFVYWFGVSPQTKEIRATEEYGGCLWVYKTPNELVRETGLTRNQVVWAVRNLKRAGVLVSRVEKGTAHYRLDPDRIEELIEAAGYQEEVEE